MRISLAFLLVLVVGSMLPLQQAFADQFNVVATIKPIHSLVAGVMKDTGEPELIMSTSASPHHYALRPSERRALARASLIFWVGPELETYMPRILDSLAPTTANIALVDAAGIQQLPARTVHHHAGAESHIDPHIWLSPANAHAMVDAIADKLISMDAAQAQLYQANRQRLHKRIDSTDEQIRHNLSGKTTAFLSYHDAYQYFEKSYDLHNAGFVSGSEEVSPSAKYVHELRENMRDQQIHCLFYEAPNRPALVDTLTDGLTVEVYELDAMGIRQQSGEDAWFKIMNRLAEAYDACL